LFLNIPGKTRSQISDQIFLDIDPETLSFDDAADWVKLRVFDKGSFHELLWAEKYYGHKKVKTFL
jgi:hypothetical protein